MTDLGKLSTEIKDEQQVDLLYKHVATIHKSNTLSLLQNKISNILYCQAFKDIKTKEIHTISISKICEMLNYRGHNDKEIKNALRGLIGTVIEWNLLQDEKLENEDWTASTMLASVRIRPGGICEYSYSAHLRELLADPVLYGVINMAYQANFHSKYGLALYENCARFIGIKQTGWLSIDFLRNILGVPEGTYPIFRDLKRKVIEQAVNEVNLYSNMTVEPIYKKIGRKVASIKFTIEPRQKKQKINLANSSKETIGSKIEELEIYDVMKRDFGLSGDDAKKLINSYNEQYLLEKIEYCNSRTNIKNKAAFLKSAIKEDYKKTSISDLKTQNIHQAIDELKIMQSQNFVQEFLAMVSNTEMGMDCVQRFENSVQVNFPEVYKAYKDKDLSDSNVALHFENFVREKFTSIYDLIKGDNIINGS